jgi:hypothetical protein
MVAVPPYPPQAFVPGPADAPAPPPILVRDPGNPDFWVGVDGLLWWTKSPPLPVPVVTTGPASLSNAGNLDAPGTTSLNGPLHLDMGGGARLFLGGWFEPGHVIGIDGSLFFLGRQTAGFSLNDPTRSGNFVINEPLLGSPFPTQISAPGVGTGGIAVDATSRFWGADVNLLYNLYRNNGWTVNLLGGYRYLQLNETLTITANSTVLSSVTYADNMGNILVTAPTGSTLLIVDQFGTRNQFNGGQIGATFQYQSGRWFVGGAAKLAIGDTHEVTTVNGFTNVYPVNGSPVPIVGGNYATIQMGRYAVDRFALAPEAQINIGYEFLPGLRGLVGYNFLYLSNVARPGNQIDNFYDGVSRPMVPLTSSSYWGQGLTLSLQFSF